MARLSIRARLIWGAALVLLAFLAGAGWAVQQAHADSVRAQRFARLQTTIYLLMAGAELNANGALVMPAALAEPRLELPGSGLYASIANTDVGLSWQSPSTLGLSLPFERDVATGQWQYHSLPGTTANKIFLAASYGVKWSVNNRAATLVFSVLEDSAAFNREMAAFERTLWLWLGGTGVLLLLTQTLLLRWGLAPLQQVKHEIQRIESGQQSQVQGHYPDEIAGITDNLNTLIEQAQARQTRYKDALDDLAHSLKSPLAVMRTALNDTSQLPATVAQQVTRMDDIVRHQLGRAAASGAARFAPQLLLAPIVQRIQDSLAKVYADKQLAFMLDCAPHLSWRLDEGDAFELFGNVLDNAAKWAKSTVAVRIWIDAERLHIRITDDGPGFGAIYGDMQAVLERRVRLDESVAGHGIGLAVVSDLVASYQGKLSLSRTDTGGAQLEIVLPAA